MSDQKTVLEPEFTKQITELERRLAERHDCEVLASCFLDPTREHLWATVRDVSRSGIGILTGSELQLGTRMLLHLQGTSLHTSLILAARVVRVKKAPSGKWLSGCKFIGDLKDKELRGFLNQQES
jgi:hypothetical protein